MPIGLPIAQSHGSFLLRFFLSDNFSLYQVNVKLSSTICMSIWLHICLFTMLMSGTCRKQKWELDPLEQLEVQMVESHHVSVGTKSNPYPLQEEKILLTSEPSFQLLIIFLTLFFTWWWLTEFIVWFDGLDNSRGYMITWYLSQVSNFYQV